MTMIDLILSPEQISLVSAAPDLLAACEAALPLLIEVGELVPDGVYFDNQPVIDRLEAAIAKARGRQREAAP
jgi:hypothetical protein